MFSKQSQGLRNGHVVLAIALAVVFTCPWASAGGSAKADPGFCAVDYSGIFSHMVPGVGEADPRRTDLPEKLTALALSPDGILYGVTADGSEGQLYIIDPFTGGYEAGASVSLSVLGMAFSPSGDLYAVSESLGTYTLGILDPLTGGHTTIGPLNGVDPPRVQGLAFSSSGVLYGVYPYDWVVDAGTYLHTIDTDDAELHTVGYAAANHLCHSIAFAPDGRLYGLGRQFAELNPYSGQPIGSVLWVGDNYRGLEYVPGSGVFFTKVPRGGWVEEGASLTLEVGVAGTYGNLGYQWFLDEVAIADATLPEYTMDPVTPDDEGWYSCQVTDEAKAVHETPSALVQVFPPGSLPVMGLVGLCIVAVACMVAGALIILRRET